MQSGISEFFSDVTDWLKKPFDASGSAFNWILFVGLLAVAAFLWQLVLLELTREV